MEDYNYFELGFQSGKSTCAVVTVEAPKAVGQIRKPLTKMFHVYRKFKLLSLKIV